MKNIKTKKLRKFTKKNTKRKLRKLIKKIIIEKYLYSIKEAQRQGIEYRELNEYLIKKGFLTKKEKRNPLGNNRFEYRFSDNFIKLLEKRLKDIIVFEDENIINFIKLLYCNDE